MTEAERATLHRRQLVARAAFKKRREEGLKGDPARLAALEASAAALLLTADADGVERLGFETEC